MTDDTPIVVLLPGLTGCGCCEYIISIVKEINRCKYSCVLNNRGTCRRKLKTPRAYCASNTSDVALVFDRIKSRCPDAPMIAVGISFGVLLVFNYLADEPQDRKKPCPLTAAMCICMPWDVIQTSDKLEKSLDWLLFNKPLMAFVEWSNVLSKEYDVPRILKSRSIREFDDNLTACMFGYKSTEEYYTCASTVNKVDRVRIPILCLNVADDPFVSLRSLPLEAVNETGSRAVLALTHHGGHIGFLAGPLPTGPSLLDRAVPQFVSAVFQHPEDFAVAAAAAASSGEEDSNVKCEEDENESTKETAATFY
eukprot:TsM_000499200 transcript=TsM_000499200 gene=TsM_000499200